MPEQTRTNSDASPRNYNPVSYPQNKHKLKVITRFTLLHNLFPNRFFKDVGNLNLICAIAQ